MSGKRLADGVEGVPAAKKGRNLSIHTAHKWIAENEKELATATWLTYERLDRKAKFVRCSNRS